MALKTGFGLTAAVMGVLALAGCGRKGPLDPPGTGHRLVEDPSLKHPKPVTVPPGPPREQAGQFPTNAPDNTGKIGSL